MQARPPQGVGGGDVRPAEPYFASPARRAASRSRSVS